MEASLSIATFSDRMRAAGSLDDAGLAGLEADVAQEIARTVAFAEAGTWEPVESLEQDVYTRPHPDHARIFI
jgi:TPP-dependent pyruvate/acetoin dehydrogenase alpha subunit